MIDAKDMARKATAGCSHSVKVIVPCADCTEANLRNWERAVRDDEKSMIRDEWNRMKGVTEASEREVKAMKVTLDRLKMVVTTLEQANSRLRDQLKAANEEISGMRAQLHAEQAVIQGRTMRVVSE